MDTTLLKENERLDNLDCNNMFLISNKDLYCPSSDSVMLANSVKANSKDLVVELCSGSGIISLLVSAKTNAKHITMVELQQCMADMAERSVKLNNLSEKIDVLNENLIGIENILGCEKFDIVVCNPPYFKTNTGCAKLSPELAIARHEIHCSFEDVAKTANKLLKFGGKLFLVHKCERLSEILTTLSNNNLQPKELFTITTTQTDYCDTFIVIAKKGSKIGIKVKNIKHL